MQAPELAPPSSLKKALLPSNNGGGEKLTLKPFDIKKGGLKLGSKPVIGTGANSFKMNNPPIQQQLQQDDLLEDSVQNMSSQASLPIVQPSQTSVMSKPVFGGGNKATLPSSIIKPGKY